MLSPEIFFPWFGVADLEKAIHNLSIVMSTTFNTSVRAFGYQQIQIDNLAKIILQNHRALKLLPALQGETYSLLAKECCLYVNKSGKIT